MGFALDYIDRKTKAPVDLGANAALEKAKANQAADDRITADDYAAATAPELNGYDAYVAAAIGGASRTLSGKRGGGAKFNEGRFKGKTKFQAMQILDKEYRELPDEAKAQWEQRQNTPLSQSQIDMRTAAANARNKIAVAGTGQGSGDGGPTGGMSTPPGPTPTSGRALPGGVPLRDPGAQTPATPQSPTQPAPSTMEMAPLAQSTSGTQGAARQSTGPVQGARGLGNEPLLPADRPAAPPSWEGKNAASSFRQRAQTAMAMRESTPTQPTTPPPVTKPGNGQDIVRNDSMTRRDRTATPQSTRDLMATMTAKPPVRAPFDPVAAKAQAEKEVSGMLASARANAPRPETGDRSVPLPQPPTSGRADETRGYMRATAEAMRKRNPGMEVAKGELPPAPKPTVTAGRSGKTGPAQPDRDLIAYQNRQQPTEMTPIAPGTGGGRRGATKRVPVSPARTASTFASR